MIRTPYFPRRNNGASQLALAVRMQQTSGTPSKAERSVKKTMIQRQFVNLKKPNALKGKKGRDAVLFLSAKINAITKQRFTPQEMAALSGLKQGEVQRIILGIRISQKKSAKAKKENRKK